MAEDAVVPELRAGAAKQCGWHCMRAVLVCGHAGLRGTNSSGGSLQEVAVREAALQALVASLDLLQPPEEQTFLSPRTCRCLGVSFCFKNQDGNIKKISEGSKSVLFFNSMVLAGK